MRQRKVLLIEDDRDLVRAVRPALEEAGFAIVVTEKGREGLQKATSESFDAIVLDVGLPDTDGFEVCHALRSANVNTPLLFLTSRGDEVDRVTGFAVGADDYVTKPFSVRELVFRIKALLRRWEWVEKKNAGEIDAEIRVGELRIEPAQRRCYLRDAEVELSALEFDVLLFFAQNLGKPYSREQLMEQIWAVNSSNFAASVTTQISRLRRKIEPDPANPTYLRTVYGVGYRFVDPERDGLPE